VSSIDQPAQSDGPAGEHLDSSRIADLIQDLSDPESAVREAAAQELGRMRGAAAVGPLIARYEDLEEDVDVRYQAALALGRIGGEVAFAALARFLEPGLDTLYNTEVTIGWETVEALGLTGDDRALPLLLAALDDERDVDMRKAARAGLIHLGERAVTPVITVLLDRTKTSVTRIFAATTLGWLGDPRAGEPCQQVLADRDDEQYVRGQAAQTLGRVGGPGAYDLLVSRVRDRREVQYVRRGAITGLGYLGDRRAYKLLLRMLMSPEMPLRVAAATALGNLGEPHAARPLRKALRDADFQVRLAAARALGQIGDERTIPALLAAQEVEEESPFRAMVCRAAGEAITRISERHRANT
jgi:HEAT repeat protein